MNRRTFGLALATGGLLLGVPRPSAQAQCELAKLLGDAGLGPAFFGNTVAIDGPATVIGAYWDDDNGWVAGAAYVFRFDGANWVREAKLLASDGRPDDEFASSVAVSGNLALIGAPGYVYADPPRPGSTYVFRYKGSSWVEEARLLASDGADGDHFGYSVAISGDTAVIGARLDDDHGVSSGVAYVFRSEGSSWVEQAKLLASDGVPGDCFGANVAVSSSLPRRALIGASFSDDNGPESGSAYVFRCDGSSWVEEAKLLPSDPAPYQIFGGAVAISGRTALIGAHGDSDNGWFAGAAYVFTHDGSSWVEQAKLRASDGGIDDCFGNSVAISGDPPRSAVIGAWRDSDNAWLSGSAYVFSFDGSNWVEQRKLMASDGAEFDEFGFSVSVSGTTAVIGAPMDDEHGGDAGSAYLYDLDPIPGDLDCDSAVDQSDLGILLADWGCTSDCVGDIDGDDDTDQDDLAILLDNWGNTRS